MLSLTVSILRDGHYVGTYVVAESTSQDVVNKMVGREIGMYPSKMDEEADDTRVLLEVRHLSNEVADSKILISSSKRGEILGLAGLVGTGRSEVAKAICGLYPKENGEILFKGKPLEITLYEDAIKNGIVYLTEDRKAEGVFLDLPLKQNISAMDIKQVSSKGFVDKKKENRQARSLLEKLRVKYSSLSQKASSLSGGNQQKLLIAKLLSVKPAIVLMDEPTRGIDVGAKAEIHRLLRELASQGIGVIMISSELPEVIGMCDRVLVMHEGTQCGILTRDEITEKRIIHLASGL